MSEEEEFWTLVVGLRLVAPGTQAPGSSTPSASCLEWPAASAFHLVTQWCREVTGIPEAQSEHSLTRVPFRSPQILLVQDPHWAAPRLLQLPDNYNIIFQYYHRKACSACQKVPKDPALCLVCGTFFCLKGQCSKQQGICDRGKPLFLCAERYRMLEQQWVSHTFDHINKRWGPHYNGL
ncbi:hypothetical protein CRUP_011594 [Coryphaenoides rupestris]|nr:hypothetical protein CRUP_011594 [Coryphaenoides rupestris]